MKNPLAVYLHDHLAGAQYALDLVRGLEDRHKDEPLGQFAAQLYLEISSDKEVLHQIVQYFGPASDVLKDSAAWLAEKVSRI